MIPFRHQPQLPQACKSLWSLTWSSLVIFAVSGLAGLPTYSAAQAAEDKAASTPSQGEQDSDPDHNWLTFYYQNPEPEKVVEQLKKWSDAKVLSDERARPALVGFLSQVFRQNRDKIKQWYLDISDLPPEDLQTIRLALIFSRTSEGDEIIREEEGDEYVDRRPPKVLEMPMTQLPTFDMLWGYFFATGSEEVIRRMVFLFRYEEMDVGEDVDIPEDYAPLYEQLPDAAGWALASNAEQHPLVLEVLERYYQTAGALEPIERKGVRKVLSELLPKKYPPAAEDKEATDEDEEEPAAVQ